MKKLAVLALLVLLIPSVLAVISKMDAITLESNLVRQGYQFAHVKGINSNPDTSILVRHWHVDFEAGGTYARCEIEDNILINPGPFDIEIAVQCQTRSGLSAVFPVGLKVKLQTELDENAPISDYKPQRIFLETEPHERREFPVRISGHATAQNRTNSTGTFLFFAGIGAIVVLTILILLSSLMPEDD